MNLFFEDVKTYLNDQTLVFGYYNARTILNERFPTPCKLDVYNLKIYTLKVVSEKLDVLQFDQASQIADWLVPHRSSFIQN